jgi:hypothetical protein
MEYKPRQESLRLAAASENHQLEVLQTTGLSTQSWPGTNSRICSRRPESVAKSNITRGVVTVADSAYFQGLMMLYRSVRRCWPVPIACFDVGLTDEQRELAGDTPGLEILPLPQDSRIDKIKFRYADAPSVSKHNTRVWPLWICPILIAAAPFRRVFWLDCDIAVLRRLDELFGLLDTGPVFTPENWDPAVTPNKPELYDLLPISRPFDPLEPRVNGGVSGWDLVRDRAVLDAYIHPIMRACDDERISNAISWHDQGSLIWAIQNCGMQHRVAQTTSWNLCVAHTSLVDKPVPWDSDFLANVKNAVPNANLLHWNGNKVPWPK